MPSTVPSSRYYLTLLLIVHAFNVVDRQAFGLLLQDIKLDVGLSDTQLGVLTGIAFAFFYSVMGIPIARWADRGNRVTIITLATAIWSATVALSGMAANFAQLLLARIVVAVGEAGCLPPASSLIADYYARAQRPKALAIFMLGAPVGSVIGFLVAGWLNDSYGWRVTFMALGAPGLALSGLVWLTLREPRKDTLGGAALRTTVEAHREPGIKEVCVTLWSQKTFRHLLLGFSVMSFFTYGIAQWQPAFFVRSFGLRTGELGSWMAAIYGLGAFVGTYWGGALASRYLPNHEALQFKMIGVVYASFAVGSALIYLSSNYLVAFSIMGLSVLAVATATGPVFAAMQTLVPARMRAMTVAIVFLFSNLIGLGLGPLVAGGLSDWYRPWAGEESLRYALLTLCPGFLWGAWHLWRASTTVALDLADIESRQDAALSEHAAVSVPVA